MEGAAFPFCRICAHGRRSRGQHRASFCFSSCKYPPADLIATSQTVLVIKYVVPHYPESYGINWGVANVLQSSEFLLCAFRRVELMLLFLLQSPSCSGELTASPHALSEPRLTRLSPRSSVVLWIAQNAEAEYDYNITL